MSLTSNSRNSGSSSTTPTHPVPKLRLPTCTVPNENITAPKCNCKRDAALRTSWTAKNPSRRFFICKSGKCSYWEWCDRELTSWECFAMNHIIKMTKDVEREIVLVNDKFEEIEALKSERSSLVADLQKQKNEDVMKEKEITYYKFEVEKLKERARGSKFLSGILLFIVCVQFAIIFAGFNA